MAHFELVEGGISRPVAHHSVDEIWYFLEGLGVMWRKLDGREETVRVETGVCITIPCGTHFQFRSIGPGPLKAVAITMPPWPGDGEAYAVQGLWKPTK
jgi:mannose-6-phosphate isomerase-like protein (cupin superfamily)